MVHPGQKRVQTLKARVEALETENSEHRDRAERAVARLAAEEKQRMRAQDEKKKAQDELTTAEVNLAAAQKKVAGLEAVWHSSLFSHF